MIIIIQNIRLFIMLILKIFLGLGLRLSYYNINLKTRIIINNLNPKVRFIYKDNP